jgi:hypothetical protein
MPRNLFTQYTKIANQTNIEILNHKMKNKQIFFSKHRKIIQKTHSNKKSFLYNLLTKTYKKPLFI